MADLTCCLANGDSQPSVCVPDCWPGVCYGDGIIWGDEECDDGNLDDGDGCSSTCTVEYGWDCTGEPSVCEQAIPTVSEWGLIVMTLLLLVGLKVKFGRRPAA